MAHIDFTSSVLSVSDAAGRLQVHPSRVHSLIRSGILDAEKIAGRWMIYKESVEQRVANPVVDGRPFSPRNAWGVLRLAEGGDPDWLSRFEKSRLRSRLRRDGLASIAPRLRSRAEHRSYRAHPSSIGRMVEDPEIVKSGVSAAAHHSINVIPSLEIEGYISANRADDIEHRYTLQESREHPNVILRVVRDLWPFEEGEGFAGPAASAIDLLESDNARSRRAAQEALAQLDARLSQPDESAANLQ